MNFLTNAEQLKNELDSLRPFDGGREARIMQKFRLEWNYHSNNLEGNSLTYGETKALILFGITAQGKPLKDHLEITRHNKAINRILDLVKGGTKLTEHFIRQFHTLLLEESIYKEAFAPDGTPARRKIEAGKYKSRPNHFITVTGETLYFATPEETPAKMHDLLEWFREEKEKPNVNPIILAALFHYRFIRIHPFDDGNGRTARILMNFILMQFGYPPVIIRTEDQQNYFAALHRADAGDLESYSDYIAQNLVLSLKTMIRGAEGSDDVEEADDFDRELALLKEKVKNVGRTVKVSKNSEVLLEVFEHSLKPLINKFIEICQKFDELYIKTQLLLFYGNAVMSIPKNEAAANAKLKILDTENFPEVSLDYKFINFRQTGFDDFNFNSRINIRFDLARYRIILGEVAQKEPRRRNDFGNAVYMQLGLDHPGYSEPAIEDEKEKEFEVCEKLYSEQISADEIENIVKIIANLHKELLEGKIEEKVDAKKRADGFIDWS